MKALHELTAAEAGRLIHSRDISPVDLVNALLSRISAVDDRLHSYLLVDAEGALAAARHAEAEIAAGRWLGPLHGVPFGAKDNFFSKGLRTCANSRVLLDHVPDFDAAMVSRLRSAGAILLGKLNTWEFGTGHGLHFDDGVIPAARNPWNVDCFTGGSSTGAGASVAGGTAVFALGADTGGSIRAPAAACGITGLKPTYGRISRHGILPNSWSMDVPGPMAWTVEDCALILQATAGYDPADSATVDIAVPDYLAALEGGCRGLRIGYIPDVGDGIVSDHAVRAGMEDLIAVLKDAGAVIEETRLPLPPARYREVTSLISGSERATVHEADFKAHADLMGEELRGHIMMGSSARAVDYIAAQRMRRVLADGLADLIDKHDALVLPGAHHTAPPIADAQKVRDFMGHSVTAVFNVSGHPALAIPTGFDEAGLPTSCQIVGRYFDEASVLRVGRVYERARPWVTRRPEL